MLCVLLKKAILECKTVQTCVSGGNGAETRYEVAGFIAEREYE